MQNKTGLWKTIEAFVTPAAVLAEWRMHLGAEFDAARAFLEETAEQADSYPCTNSPSCGDHHEIRFVEDDGGILAVLPADEPIYCRAIMREPRDILIHALDKRKLCEAIRAALGLDAASRGPVNGAPRTYRVGSWGPAQVPVFLMTPYDDSGFLKEAEVLFSAFPDPFIVLTPTGVRYTQLVETVFRRYMCVHVALSRILVIEAGGSFRVIQLLDACLADFERRLANRPVIGEMVQGISQEVRSIRAEHIELRKAKARLEEMLAQGVFSFTQRVDPRSFKILCTVLADGDIAKASRTLKVKDASLREALRSWRDRGPAYAAMLELVRWRKKVGRKTKVPLNDAILHEKAVTTDFPGLIADVFDDLLSMSGDNWELKCEDLMDLLRPYIPR